jgi:hypothetical protein
MKRVVTEIQLCYAATVTPDGKPNLSPKGSITDDIGLGELAGVAVSAATEFVLEVIEKGGVQIDPLVTQAIERAHGRPRKGARRWLRGEQAQLGGIFGPAILGVPKQPGTQTFLSDRSERVTEIRRLLANYQKLKKAIGGICELNHELLRPDASRRPRG